MLERPSVSLVTSVSKGWFHEQGGFTFPERYYMDPLYRWDQEQAMEALLVERFPDYALFNLESNLVQPDYHSPDQVLVGGIQPNLILSACLGGEFLFYPEYDADVLGTPLSGIRSTAELPVPTTFLDHPLIQNFDRQIRSLQAERPDLCVIPPFFWDTSGRATIHGFITTSFKLYGTEIFLRMVEEPDFVTALHGWIVDVYGVLIRHFAELTELPVTSVHIGECSGAMVGRRHYEALIVPFASRMGRELGPIRWHSCGRSDHLLEAIAQIDNLHILDTGSNTSVAAMRGLFGPDFRIDLAPDVQLLMETTPRQDVAAWLDRTLVENDSGPLQIGYHYEPGYSLVNCLSLHDELDRRGLAPKGRI